MGTHYREVVRFLLLHIQRIGSSWWTYLGVATFLFLLSMAVNWPALKYPMFTDDLYMVREFTPQEVLDTFRGDWIPSQGIVKGAKIDIQAYRPLTTVFNDLRAIAFGDGVIRHRTLNLLLFSISLSQTVWILRKFNVAWIWALTAAVLMLFARYSVSQYMWIVNGSQLLRTILTLLSGQTLILYLGRRQRVLLAFSLMTAFISLLVREDAVAVLLAFPVIAFGMILDQKGMKHTLIEGLGYYFSLLSVIVVYLLLRLAFVPQAPPLEFQFSNVAKALLLAVSGYVGRTAFDLKSLLAVWLIPTLIIIVLVSSIVRSIRSADYSPLYWLIASLIAAVIVGMNRVRTDLLFVSMLFLSGFIAITFSRFDESARPLRFWLFLSACIFMISIMYVHPIALEAYHPYSSNQLLGNAARVYGPYRRFITIPRERRRMIERLLAEFGIKSEEQIYQDTAGETSASDDLHLLVNEALENGIRRPTNSVQIFVPYLGVLGE